MIPACVTLPLRRIFAVVSRVLYVLKGNPYRLLDILYWPSMEMCLWGFLSISLRSQTLAAGGAAAFAGNAAGILIGGMLLWDILNRGSLGVSVSFLEEIWSRNLANLFVTPLRLGDYIAALLILSVLRTLAGVLPAALLAIVFYSYNVFSMGLPLVGFFALLLVAGWSVGILCMSLILRIGPGAENIAWVAIFFIAPLSGIYYPIAVMPVWMQGMAWCLPSSWVFEGMRAVVYEQVFHWSYFWWALALDGLYLALAIAVFHRVFHVARERGLLLGGSE
jgi:ABC-2 type transport system permease protein